MYFAYITARVHQMIMQQWHAATTTRHSYTLTCQFLTDLQTFVELLRDIQFGPRGPPRRASAYEISKSTGFHVDFGFQSGFLDFTVDFWISVWISGFQFGFLDFTVDFWISVWISGFQFGFLPTGFFLYVLRYFSYSSQLSKNF